MSLTPDKQKPKRAGWHELRFVPAPGKVHKTCRNCGVDMFLPPSKAHEYHTCGPVCLAAVRAAEKRLRERRCETCDRVFVPRPVQLRVGQGRYCSQACNAAWYTAGNTPEARSKARASRKASLAAGNWTPASGERAGNWKGGKQAFLQRQREGGKAAARLRAYRAKNPDKVREFTKRRNSRKIGRLPRGTVQRIREMQRGRCAICRASIKAGYHLDHIMPLALGGEHAPRNIQLLCETCNVRKNAKHPITYMRELGRLL